MKIGSRVRIKPIEWFVNKYPRFPESESPGIHPNMIKHFGSDQYIIEETVNDIVRLSDGWLYKSEWFDWRIDQNITVVDFNY